MTHDEIAKIAQTVCESGMSEYRQWQDAYVIIATGLELGVRPMRALQTIHNMRGKPSPSAALVVGLVKGAEVCQRWKTVESTDEQCTISTLRAGEDEPETLTYTMRDAKRAGLGGGNWNKFPRQMLYARCSAELARRVYPDVVAGLYVPEELDHGSPNETPTKQDAPRVSDISTKRERMTESDKLPAYVRAVAAACEDEEIPSLFKQAMVIMQGSPADRVRELATGVLGKYEHMDGYLDLFGEALAQTSARYDAVRAVWDVTAEDKKWKAAHDVARNPDQVAEIAALFDVNVEEEDDDK